MEATATTRPHPSLRGDASKGPGPPRRRERREQDEGQKSEISEKEKKQMRERRLFTKLHIIYYFCLIHIFNPFLNLIRSSSLICYSLLSSIIINKGWRKRHECPL